MSQLSGCNPDSICILFMINTPVLPSRYPTRASCRLLEVPTRGLLACFSHGLFRIQMHKGIHSSCDSLNLVGPAFFGGTDLGV